VGTIFGLFYVKNPEMVEERLQQRKSSGSMYEDVAAKGDDVLG
jgi:hypothetical protein